MSELPLEIGKFYDMPDGWEVYVAHPQGGYVTLFRGTEQEGEEFAAGVRGDPRPPRRAAHRPHRGT